MLDSMELSELLLKSVRKRKLKLYVIAADELVSVESEEFAIICNTENHKVKRGHWVAFFKTHREGIEFFDSFGLHPALYSKHFMLFLNKHTNGAETFARNDFRLQDFDSTVCGNYCVYYLYMRSVGFSLPSSLCIFSPNHFKQNDELVYQLTACKLSVDVKDDNNKAFQISDKCTTVNRLLRSYSNNLQI